MGVEPVAPLDGRGSPPDDNHPLHAIVYGTLLAAVLAREITRKRNESEAARTAPKGRSHYAGRPGSTAH